LLETFEPQLRQVVNGVSPHMTGCNPGPVHIRFTADKVAMGQVLLQIFQLPLLVSFHHFSMLICILTLLFKTNRQSVETLKQSNTVWDNGQH